MLLENYFIKILPSSTSGIIERLVAIIISQHASEICTSPKMLAKNGMKYTDEIKIKRLTKLKLNILLFKILILKMLFSVLQFIE